MGKRQIAVLGLDEDIIEARRKGINLSKLFRNSLRIELNMHSLEESLTKDEVISALKSKLSKSLSRQDEIISEKSRQDKEILALKKRITELEEKKKKNEKDEWEKILNTPDAVLS